MPTAPVTVAVSLADKLDSLTQFFAAGMQPTGSKDPFALRRSALGVIRLLTDNSLRMPIARENGLLEFFADRLKVQQREAGVRPDLIDAVFALGGEDDLVRLLARVSALQAFVTTEDGRNLLAGYKRSANILKKEEGSWSPGGSDGEAPAEERALADALAEAGPRALAAVEAEEFGQAMRALAALRGPIDAFFEAVTVNDPDPAIRARRLGLLDRFKSAVHTVADFSKIEG